MHVFVCPCASVCLCVCVRARARACVCAQSETQLMEDNEALGKPRLGRIGTLCQPSLVRSCGVWENPFSEVLTALENVWP